MRTRRAGRKCNLLKNKRFSVGNQRAKNVPNGIENVPFSSPIADTGPWWLDCKKDRQ
jgi:hypothetical protein